MTQQDNGGADVRGVIPWPLRMMLDDAETRGFAVDWQKFIDECKCVRYIGDTLAARRAK